MSCVISIFYEFPIRLFLNSASKGERDFGYADFKKFPKGSPEGVTAFDSRRKKGTGKEVHSVNNPGS